jgi:hypothetical protein
VKKSKKYVVLRREKGRNFEFRIVLVWAVLGRITGFSGILLTTACLELVEWGRL